MIRKTVKEVTTWANIFIPTAMMKNIPICMRFIMMMAVVVDMFAHVVTSLTVFHIILYFAKFRKPRVGILFL